MNLQTHGTKKYPASQLLKSSAGLGWTAISAELRSHGVGASPVIVPQQIELCLAILGNDAGLVICAGAGRREEVIPTTGIIGLLPVGVSDDEVAITAPIPKALHLYLPTTQFRCLNDDFNLPASPTRSIRYLHGFRDELIEQIGKSVLSEMTAETSTGRMFVETASLMLAAHLINSYQDSGSNRPPLPATSNLDHARLRRVLEFISAHLDDDITLVELAKVAGVSLCHFAHRFTLAVGVSPHRYISRMRLERAMANIAAAKLSLAQIAFDAGFSSQASFTRAFRRATGMTPGEYRSRRR